MERDESPREIIASGFAENGMKRVIGLLKRNEYKRRQAPPGVRVTERGFGKDSAVSDHESVSGGVLNGTFVSRPSSYSG